MMAALSGEGRAVVRGRVHVSDLLHSTTEEVARMYLSGQSNRPGIDPDLAWRGHVLERAYLDEHHAKALRGVELAVPVPGTDWILLAHPDGVDADAGEVIEVTSALGPDDEARVTSKTEQGLSYAALLNVPGHDKPPGTYTRLRVVVVPWYGRPYVEEHVVDDAIMRAQLQALFERARLVHDAVAAGDLRACRQFDAEHAVQVPPPPVPPAEVQDACEELVEVSIQLKELEARDEDLRARLLPTLADLKRQGGAPVKTPIGSVSCVIPEPKPVLDEIAFQANEGGLVAAEAEARRVVEASDAFQAWNRARDAVAAARTRYEKPGEPKPHLRVTAKRAAKKAEGGARDDR